MASCLHSRAGQSGCGCRRCRWPPSVWPWQSLPRWPALGRARRSSRCATEEASRPQLAAGRNLRQGQRSVERCATKRGDAMRGNLHRLYRQTMSPWGVAPGGDTPGVKKLPLKGTREARCKPPRSEAWLRDRMVSASEAGFNLRESSPLPRNILHSLGMRAQADTGQRPRPTVVVPPSDDQGWSKPDTSHKDAAGHLRTLLPVGIPRRVGWVASKPPPTRSHEVHRYERGRPMGGGVSSPDEAHGRRRLHSTRRLGKPATWEREPACRNFEAE
jgi:hypothetical protein